MPELADGRWRGQHPGHVIEMRVPVPDDWRTWRALRLAALAEAPTAFGSQLADWQGKGDHGNAGVPG